jgi:hypothetical protein
MAGAALSVLPPAPSLDLVAFVNRHNRFPRLGDSLAPWHYRGWLLAYVILIHERCASVASRMTLLLFLVRVMVRTDTFGTEMMPSQVNQFTADVQGRQI